MNRSVAIIGTRGYPSYYGGFETAVRYLAPYLAAKGWSVTVYGRPGATKQKEASSETGIQTVDTRGFETKSLSTLSYGLTATLDVLRRRPDVVLVMNVANGFWLPLLRLAGIRTLVNVDGIEWERAKWGRSAKLMFKLGARMTALFGTKLVADAQEIQRRWKVEFHRDSAYIPYGGEVREQLPIEPGLSHRGYVLMVARFVPENTVEEFFASVEEIAAKAPVVIVGSAGYGGELDARAKDLDERISNVHWLGHISDDDRLHSLWQHAGAYFHGHSVGGTNPALVQAMANGAPTVARNTVYNREVLGDAAYFCDPTPEDISQTILRLMAEGLAQEELSRKAKSRVLSTFTWDAVCHQYDRELSDLLKGKTIA